MPYIHLRQPGSAVLCLQSEVCLQLLCPHPPFPCRLVPPSSATPASFARPTANPAAAGRGERAIAICSVNIQPLQCSNTAAATFVLGRGRVLHGPCLVAAAVRGEQRLQTLVCSRQHLSYGAPFWGGETERGGGRIREIEMCARGPGGTGVWLQHRHTVQATNAKIRRVGYADINFSTYIQRSQKKQCDVQPTA